MLPRCLRDPTILDAGGTSRLAGAAEKAKIQMFLETFIGFNATLGRGADQMDSAARRFGFEAKRAISRALVQAEPAMDALVKLGEIQSRELRTVGWSLFVFSEFQQFLVSGF